MARFIEGASELSITAVAAGAIGLAGDIDNLWESVRIVAEAEGLKQALRFLWQTKERSSEAALSSHYAVFRTSH